MALNWSIEKVENWKDLANDAEERKVTEAMVWASMTLGFSKITEANEHQVAIRFAMYEQAVGAFLMSPEPATRTFRPRPITRADVRRRIGMWTNASSMTSAQFGKALLQRLEEEARETVAHRDAEMERARGG